MRRARFRDSALLLASLACLASFAWPLGAAERPRLAILDDVECAGLSGRYVALLDSERGAVVLSAAPFPGGKAAGNTSGASFTAKVGAFDNVRLGLEAGTPDGAVWALQDRSLETARGCVAFDKDQFTWASDLLTYVRYLAGLLAEAQRLDPARTGLWVGHRTVRLAVSRPGVDRATLAGPEGAMLGYGAAAAPERWVFVPVPLGASGETVLLRVLRSEGDSMGAKPMQHLGWALLRGDQEVTTPTEPAFVVRLVAIEGAE